MGNESKTKSLHSKRISLVFTRGASFINKQEPNGLLAPRIPVQVVGIILNQPETVSIKLQARAGAQWLARRLTP